MKTQLALSWNVVARNFRVHEQLEAKLRQKISKLELHLKHFPPDAVHLQIALEKHPKKAMFTAASPTLMKNGVRVSWRAKYPLSRT